MRDYTASQNISPKVNISPKSTADSRSLTSNAGSQHRLPGALLPRIRQLTNILASSGLGEGLEQAFLLGCYMVVVLNPQPCTPQPLNPAPQP